MKISAILTATVLLSAFAAGCAVDSNAAAPVADDTQLDEASDALTRASVKGIYARIGHVAACNVASTLELRADGTFAANLSYSGPTVRCAAVLGGTVNGVYSSNRSNTITFIPGGRGASRFTLRVTRGNRLSAVTGSSANRNLFQGEFRKLGGGECLNDAACSSGQTCESLPTTMEAPFITPAVFVGRCVDPAPSGPKCGGFAGFFCPADMYCDDSARDPRIADEMFDCKPILWACPAVYAPVCGTNGITYGNACEASRIAGVSIAYDGACVVTPPSRPRCGGIAGLRCPADTICEMPVPSYPDAMGTCKPVIW